MFKRILIANRSEIACRIMVTARRLGIATVAVYADPDRYAQHVNLADQAVHIGAATASDSYLNIDKIVEAALATEADAIHPGYGFLAENPQLARRCQQQGLVYIGPTAAVIADMGDKAAAKQQALACGIPVLAGYNGELQDAATLHHQAQLLGLPLLIKALAGGGGRGLRRVDTMNAFDAALASAKRESLAAFADDRVLLEQYVINPRHVEVQILADQHGGCIALPERDCSIQRKHQKIIEETPAPGLSAEIRVQLAQSATRLARQVEYSGAGTVEFLLAENQYWFMEMNTRLQVEHPVTEMVTGVDLVEWQLRIAAGKHLNLSTEQSEANGHSIEARLYAEDADNDFIPTHGRLDLVRLPQSSRQMRVESALPIGISGGAVIGTWYDAMIAKLIGYGENREQALAALCHGLEQTRVVGITTNRLFLLDCLQHDDFVGQRLSTGFLQQTEFCRTDDAVPMIAAALSLHCRTRAMVAADATEWHATDGWRLYARQPATYPLFYVASRYDVIIEAQNTQWLARIGAETMLCHSIELSATNRLSGNINGQQYLIDVVFDTSTIEVVSERFQQRFRLRPESATTTAETTEQPEIHSSLPGKILECRCSPGQSVNQGDVLFLIESMKMEHSINSPFSGVLQQVYCAADDMIEAGQLLARLQ